MQPVFQFFLNRILQCFFYWTTRPEMSGFVMQEIARIVFCQNHYNLIYPRLIQVGNHNYSTSLFQVS